MALRTVYPLVLGLAAWFLGVLIVLTTNAGVALTDELVVSLSVGVPIGLGVYLAWVNRDSATPTNTGLAAAAGGALIGAWLGFNVTSAGFGFLAPFVAIVARPRARTWPSSASTSSGTGRLVLAPSSPA